MSYTRRIKQGGTRKSLSMRNKKHILQALVSGGILTAAAAAALCTPKGRALINNILGKRTRSNSKRRTSSSSSLPRHEVVPNSKRRTSSSSSLPRRRSRSTSKRSTSSSPPRGSRYKSMNQRKSSSEIRKNMRVLSYNVHNGKSSTHTDGVEYRTRILTHLGADICAFQEANENTAPSGYATTVFQQSKGRTYGQSISTKTKSEEGQYEYDYLPQGPDQADYKSFIELKYAHFIIVCVHFYVEPGEDITKNHIHGSRIRRQQAEYLITRYSQAIYKNRPIILCGDFNAHLTGDYDNKQLSEDHKKLKNSDFFLDFESILPILNNTNSPFKNGESFHKCKQLTKGLITTVHNNRVDYIFVTPQVTLSGCGIYSPVNWKKSSDHKPVWIDVPIVINYNELVITNPNAKSEFGGSNPKELVSYNGIKCLLKMSNSRDIATNEVLASKLYQLAGIKVPNLTLVVDSKQSPNKWYVLSELADNYEDALMKDKQALRVEDESKKTLILKERDNLIESYKSGELRKELHFGYMTDVWLSNWDVMGTDRSSIDGKPLFANIGISNGEIIRIDVGGSLAYRAQGEPKSTEMFNATPIEDFHDKYKAEQPGILYDALGKSSQQRDFGTCIGVQNLVHIQPKQVTQTIDLYKDYMSSELFQRLSEVVVQRLDWCKKNFDEFKKKCNTLSA